MGLSISPGWSMMRPEGEDWRKTSASGRMTKERMVAGRSRIVVSDLNSILLTGSNV